MNLKENIFHEENNIATFIFFVIGVFATTFFITIVLLKLFNYLTF